MSGAGIPDVPTDLASTYVSNRDTSTTALFALGLRQGDYMVGREVTEAYQCADDDDDSSPPYDDDDNQNPVPPG